MVDELDNAIHEIFDRLFHVPAEKLSQDTRRGTLEGWDSLGHLLLIETVCERFKIEVGPEQALDIETIADLKRTIRDLRSDMPE